MQSRDKYQTWKTNKHNKEYEINQNYTYKVTRVNEQLGLH